MRSAFLLVSAPCIWRRICCLPNGAFLYGAAGSSGRRDLGQLSSNPDDACGNGCAQLLFVLDV